MSGRMIGAGVVQDDRGGGHVAARPASLELKSGSDPRRERRFIPDVLQILRHSGTRASLGTTGKTRYHKGVSRPEASRRVRSRHTSTPRFTSSGDRRPGPRPAPFGGRPRAR